MANKKVDKVADMKVDLVVGKVANMKVDMVADMVADMGVDKVADMDFSIIFWAFFGDFFCISQ